MNTEIYAVVFEESTTIPGDERSCTHPGHGYPEYTVTNKVFREFKNETEFKGWIVEESLKKYGKSFKAYRCIPVEVTTEVKVNIK